MLNLNDYLVSWKETNGVNSIDSILKWVEEKNSSLRVKIERTTLSKTKGWFYDEKTGTIHNESNSFFSITGINYKSNNINISQPIIIQNEIGFLGIITKKINGVIHFLMQAKIEPGNINKIQISPTIQATKSNFTQKHGGSKPLYLEYFQNAKKYTIVVDQIQSEQSSRFLKKRNRNIIIDIGDEEIEVFDSHKWMTLGQIKELMSIDNLVNMDTRTVISCIPFWTLKNIRNDQNYNPYVFNSLFNNDDVPFQNIFNALNDYKMFQEKSVHFVPLKELDGWSFTDEEIVSNTHYDFKIIYCNVEIEKREVKSWFQPLVAATSKAVFGLIAKIVNNKYSFLVRLKEEIGCFDCVEFGPTIQCGDYKNIEANSNIEKVFVDHLKNKKNIVFDGFLSEEGGRFYQEENRNVILLVDEKEIGNDIPKGYMWLDFKSLNYLIQSNNYVNIQLRNLLSLLKV